MFYAGILNEKSQAAGEERRFFFLSAAGKENNLPHQPDSGVEYLEAFYGTS
jgi:hypothetical protein